MPRFKHSYRLAVVLAAVLAACSFEPTAHAAPAADPSPTVAPASDDPNYPLWTLNTPLSPTVPQPMRGPLGASILGPQNIPLALENPDLVEPPTKDHGTMYVLSVTSVVSASTEKDLCL